MQPLVISPKGVKKTHVKQKRSQAKVTLQLTDILTQFWQDSNTRGHVDRFVIAFLFLVDMRAIFAMGTSFVAKHDIFHNSTFHDLCKEESI